MGADLEVRPGLAIPAAEIDETASRSRGPGGQNVNKTSTRVTLRWRPAQSGALGEAERARVLRRLASRLTRDGELLVHCDVTRSRSRNRELARERLAELLRAALARSRPRRPTRVPPAARAARLDAKQRRAATKARRARPRAED